MAEVPEFAAVNSIHGWFARVDHAAFKAVHRCQRDVAGDLLEIGVFEGRSAVVLGGMLRTGERLHVCDPFGATTADESNRRENESEYSNLHRRTFEQNYARFHSEPAVLHECLSTELELPPDSFRFVHVDGSHLLENVAHDADLARRVLGPAGVVAFDDFRKLHSPGVAATVWRVAGLTPVLLTSSKFYGAWDPGPYEAIGQHLRALGCVVDDEPFGERTVPVAAMPPPLGRRAVRAIAPAAALNRSRRLRGFVN